MRCVKITAFAAVPGRLSMPSADARHGLSFWLGVLVLCSALVWAQEKMASQNEIPSGLHQLSDSELDRAGGEWRGEKKSEANGWRKDKQASEDASRMRMDDQMRRNVIRQHEEMMIRQQQQMMTMPPAGLR